MVGKKVMLVINPDKSQLQLTT